MRAGVLQIGTARRIATTRSASPFGSVVTGSLGLPSGLPATEVGRASPIWGDPRALATKRVGEAYLPDKEVAYSRTVKTCYSARLQRNSAAYPSVVRRRGPPSDRNIS